MLLIQYESHTNEHLTKWHLAPKEGTQGWQEIAPIT